MCVCEGEFARIRRDPRTNWKPGGYSVHKESMPRDMLVSALTPLKPEEVGSAALVAFAQHGTPLEVIIDM